MHNSLDKACMKDTANFGIDLIPGKYWASTDTCAWLAVFKFWKHFNDCDFDDDKLFTYIETWLFGDLEYKCAFL